jgi:hypothetical protein
LLVLQKKKEKKDSGNKIELKYNTSIGFFPDFVAVLSLFDQNSKAEIYTYF